MAEGDDYTPASWAASDSFSSARASYDAHAGRSYASALTKGKSHEDLLPEEIKTKSPAPLIIVPDVTGSMGEWPGVIFSKLPYLDHEMRTEYLGEGAEVCFIAVGDANSDRYPLQARPFAKGADMKRALEELIIEGGGGGGGTESYELAALYIARHVKMPKAIRAPIVIFIGDERPYDTVSPDLAERYAYTPLQKHLTTASVFKELMETCSVYLVRKPYSGEGEGSVSPLREAWVKLIGEDRIAHLPEAGRVVDVIFGILAKEAGKIDYFVKELTGRQTRAQAKTVMKSLATVHAGQTHHTKTPKALPRGASMLHLPGKGTKTKPLG